MAASAIVVTVAGSYAAWDQLTATSSSTVTFDRVTVATGEVDATLAAAERTALNVLPSYSGTVNFTIDGIPDGKHGTLNLAPTVKNGNTALSTDDYDLKITQGETEVPDNTDTVTSTDSTKVYTVTVTPKETDIAKALADNSTELTVEITATLDTALTPISQ